MSFDPAAFSVSREEQVLNKRERMQNAILVDLLVKGKIEELRRLGDEYNSLKLMGQNDSNLLGHVIEEQDRIVDKQLRLLAAGQDPYFVGDGTGDVESGNYLMTQDMFNDEQNLGSGHKDYDYARERAQNKAKAIALQLASILQVEMRVIDVLGDGDCGRYVKLLLTGKSINDHPFFNNLPYGVKGGSRGQCEYLKEDELVHEDYDLIILQVNTSADDDHRLKPLIDNLSFTLSTPDNSQPFTPEKPKAIVINSNISHWFLIAPPKGLTKNAKVPFFDKTSGQSNLLWDSDAVHSMLGAASDQAYFADFRRHVTDDQKSDILTRANFFTDHCKSIKK